MLKVQNVDTNKPVLYQSEWEVQNKICFSQLMDRRKNSHFYIFTGGSSLGHLSTAVATVVFILLYYIMAFNSLVNWCIYNYLLL